MARKPIGLQVWTVRDALAADFKGTIEEIARIGYTGLETGMDTGGMSTADYKKFLGDLGLWITSTHVGVDMLGGDIQPAIDFAKESGFDWIVCPWANGESLEGWLGLAKTLDQAGAKIKDAGLQLCYHNHAHEFAQFDGKYGLDTLYANTDPELLKPQIDTYWVKKGGPEPQDYILKYADRGVPLVHFKDMANDAEQSFAEVGEGILDWPAIIAASDKAGAQWYIVEQDVCQRPAMESAKISFDNLNAML